MNYARREKGARASRYGSEWRARYCSRAAPRAGLVGWSGGAVSLGGSTAFDLEQQDPCQRPCEERDAGHPDGCDHLDVLDLDICQRRQGHRDEDRELKPQDGAADDGGRHPATVLALLVRTVVAVHGDSRDRSEHTGGDRADHHVPLPPGLWTQEQEHGHRQEARQRHHHQRKEVVLVHLLALVVGGVRVADHHEVGQLQAARHLEEEHLVHLQVRVLRATVVDPLHPVADHLLDLLARCQGGGVGQPHLESPAAALLNGAVDQHLGGSVPVALAEGDVHRAESRLLTHPLPQLRGQVLAVLRVDHGRDRLLGHGRHLVRISRGVMRGIRRPPPYQLWPCMSTALAPLLCCDMVWL